MKRNAQIEFLRNVWLFERCSRKELTLLASNTTLCTVPAGKALAREDDAGREFFIIVSGKAEATRRGEVLAQFGVGDFFGEMSLLDRRPRTATVTATVETEVLVLTAGAFTSVIESMPSVDRKMLTVLTERLREIEDRYVPPAERLLRDAI